MLRDNDARRTVLLEFNVKVWSWRIFFFAILLFVLLFFSLQRTRYESNEAQCMTVDRKSSVLFLNLSIVDASTVSAGSQNRTVSHSSLSELWLNWKVTYAFRTRVTTGPRTRSYHARQPPSLIPPHSGEHPSFKRYLL
jgi:hypothetical protein